MFRRFSDSGMTQVGPREFAGIAATSALQPDGFALVMSGADLSRFRTGGPLLVAHDSARQVGRVDSVRPTATTLAFSATFPNPGISADADTACGMVKAGFWTGISLGFNVDEAEPINPARRSDGMRATRWTAYEISLAAVPLDPNAMVTHRASALPPDVRQLVEAAAEYNEVLSPARIAHFCSEARQLGTSPAYRYRTWRGGARLLDADHDFAQRQAEALRLRECP